MTFVELLMACLALALIVGPFAVHEVMARAEARDRLVAAMSREAPAEVVALMAVHRRYYSKDLVREVELWLYQHEGRQ